MKWNAGYPIFFNIFCWTLPALIGCLAGYAAFKTIRIDLTIAVLAGMFFLSAFQHCYHVLKGKSTDKKPTPKLAKYACIYLFIILIIALYIISERPLAAIGIGLGFVIVWLYSRSHHEELYGVGHAISMPTACYITTGHLNIPVTLILAGIALISSPALFAYRALTGDYNKEQAPKVLQRMLFVFTAGLTTLAAGFTLA